MSREMWSQLKKFSDGDSLDAETLNVPIGQLGDRTAYLYARLKSLTAGDKLSSVILTDVSLSTETDKEPVVGNVVYRDVETGKFAKAKATMSLYDDFTSAESAFTIGILQTKEGSTGDVLMLGRLDLNPSGAPFQKDDMIETDEEYRPGRYYLSANEAGKLTAHPNGPLIYVCTISGEVAAGGFDGEAIVMPQYLDIGTSHVHRTAVLTARPAGTTSTAGYLPVDATAEGGPLALRFSGTWTSDTSAEYEFYLNQSSADWPDGVDLKWRKDGAEDDAYHVNIPAPDVEVILPGGDGLRVRLSLPSSSKDHAYQNLSVSQRTWDPLNFPKDGRGWTDHAAETIATTDDIENLRIAVRGTTGEASSTISIAFPGSTQIATMGTIVDGSTFTYNGTTYEFTTDVDGYSGDNTPVALGTNLADSTRYLAIALNKAGSGSFVVLKEDEDGTAAKLVAMDGADVPVDGTVVTGVATKTGTALAVPDSSNTTHAVVFDSALWVVGDSAVVESVSTYAWSSAGTVSFLIYKEGTSSVTIPLGTIVDATLTDDEPDALYDYVLGLDAAVANFWPPIPPKSAALVVNGVEMENKALFPDGPTVSFGKSTIHWFSNETGRKPWPEGFTSRSTKIDPAYDKTEVLHWVRGFQGATGPVTSLQVKSGSPLKIYGYGTEDTANTGDLEIAADFDFSVVNGGASGYLVPKRASKGKLVAGPVVERIVGGAGVSVISKAGCPSGQGTVVIALDNGAYRSHFSDVALENAEQAKVGMFPYIRLKGYTDSITHPSAFTATMRVPTNLPDGKYALMVSASVFGETGFSGATKRYACVNFGYNILPDFSATDTMRYRNLKTSLLKPDNERTVLIPFGHADTDGIVYNGFDPIYITTEDDSLTDKDDIIAKVLGKRIPAASEFSTITPELKPGYLVGIRMSRAVTATSSGITAYTGALGFINLSWTLVSADNYGVAATGDTDLYARNTSTGLYHKVVAVTDTETSEVSLGVDQEGVTK